MSPARSSAPSSVAFTGGATVRVTRAQTPATFPYVTPGTVGYLGSLAALTPYSPPGSGLPGAGDIPGPDWAWEAYGLRNDDTNITLDHAYVYGGIYWTGAGTATITQSLITAGTGSELAPFSGKGAGGFINASDTTVGWIAGDAPDSAVDTGALYDDGSLPYVYNVLRCSLSGSPQGIGPIAGTGCQIINTVVYTAQNNVVSPNHLDGIFNEGANNTLIQGCYVVSPTRSDATSALFWQSGGPVTGCVVENNYLQGGSYTLYNENATGLVVVGNTFGGGLNGDALNVSGDGGTIGLWENNIHPDGSPVPSP